MSQQHHPEPRAHPQRVPSAVTPSQASPGAAQRAVRGCRLSSSPSPCHGLAPGTLGLGEGEKSPWAGEGGDGDTETLLPNGAAHGHSPCWVGLGVAPLGHGTPPALCSVLLLPSFLFY